MQEEIYEPGFVEKLFDQMSDSYARMNYITSFGFSERWRKQCVKVLAIEKGAKVYDLMTGMGECWSQILENTGAEGELHALDISTNMLARAHKRKQKFKDHQIRILKENVFENSFPDGEADFIVSGFGIKTFNPEQLEILAKEMFRLLKPGGKLSLIEVSIPPNRLLRIFYMFYLKQIIPILGWMFLGSPETYKMLGVYTEKFENAKDLEPIFRQAGFRVTYVSYFFGCASGIIAEKS
ncbi:MAG: class I SAM-dependent methyltransferase [Bacteroidia bacterium]|nr:class I SAM-dependent methyltransferase [Bacteroidia bacterium]